MDTDTVQQAPGRHLVFAAMLIGGVWIGIGSIVLFVLAQSRPLGSRPAMGRRERWTNECSFRADLLTVAARARNLHGSLRPLNPPIQSSFDSLCSIKPGRKRLRGVRSIAKDRAGVRLPRGRGTPHWRA